MYLEELHKLKVERELGNFDTGIGPLSKERIENGIIGSFLGATCGDILGLSMLKSKATPDSFPTCTFSIQVPILLTIAESIIEKKDLHPENISKMLSSMSSSISF
jgi:hypothetical protein